MKKAPVWAAVVSIGLLGGSLHAFADSDEAGEHEAGHQHRAVTMDQLPPGVASALQREAKGGKIEELRTESRPSGAVIYEAEVVKGKKGTDFEFDANGKVLQRRVHNESAEHESGGAK